MSTLEYQEKRKFEALFGMDSGYVLEHSNRTFGNLVGDIAGIDIHSEEYCTKGTSKANKFRTFWEKESDTLVGRVLLELIHECKERSRPEEFQLIEECEAISNRLLAGEPNIIRSLPGIWLKSLPGSMPTISGNKSAVWRTP